MGGRLAAAVAAAAGQSTPPDSISVDGNDCGNGMEVKDTLKVPIKPPEAAR